MHRRLISAAFLAAVLAAPAASHAQEAPDGLAGLLLRFFSPSNPVVLQPAPDPFNHAAHFVSQPNAQETLRQLNRGIASQLSTFPLGSSSAGFTYTFDPELGVFNRSTETFGPVFSERPLTAGKGKFSFGATHLRATYDRFEGQDLKEGDIRLYLTHQDVNEDGSLIDPAVWFEGDIIEAALSVDLRNDTTVLYANYGVSDSFDIGLAVPYSRLDMEARIDADIEHLATEPDPFVVHAFPGGENREAFFETGSAEGIGDIVLRGKYNFFKGARANVAAALDLRLPTGKTEDLLGSGATQARLYAIAAAKGSKRFSPRVSFGYTYSSGGADFVGDLPNEISYSAGFDAALHRRATLTADFLGRTLLDADRLVLRERTFDAVHRNDPTVRQTIRISPETATGNLDVLLGSAGIKVNVVSRLLVMANVLFAIGDSGLQDKVTPVFGIDYSF